MRSPLAVWMPVLALLVFGFFLFRDPDAAFRSSDGKWADSEVQFKNCDLRGLVMRFELYKLQCHAPKVELLRATPQLWYDVFAWPSYAMDRKWRVPYSDAHPEIGDYYPPATSNACPNGDWSNAQLERAQASAERYLRGL